MDFSFSSVRSKKKEKEAAAAAASIFVFFMLHEFSALLHRRLDERTRQKPPGGSYIMRCEELLRDSDSL